MSDVRVTEQDLKDRVRAIPLLERLEECHRMIGEMCSDGRCPKMSIPVQWYDEDFYIGTTLDDAAAALKDQSGAGL